MIIQKRTIMRISFMVEIIVFSWFYYYGVGGIQEIYQLQEENKSFEQRIVITQQAIEQKQEELAAWQSDSFYKEKLAREQLHMAKEGEEIYLVGRG